MKHFWTRREDGVRVLTVAFLYAPLLLIPGLYLATMARSLVLGDPTEYTLVAHVLGIAHPPGYAFMTLAGKLFQTLIPFGDIPWRTHLLATAAATTVALFVFFTIRRLRVFSEVKGLTGVAALFAALTVATGTDVWQHAIHTNPHIITATFLAANLFFLTRWWAAQRENAATGDGWLFAFSLAAGLGVTHHPLTVFSLPAYALFILYVRPSIWKEWRTVLKMVALALLGLAVWLYFPLRSPMQPVFGPDDMNTLDGFLDHVLARGLSESLPFFGFADQPARALVFWTLLRLQYSVPTIVLAAAGAAWLWRSSRRALFLLYGLAFLGNYLFVINLRAQDIMAYLLGPFIVVGLLAGVGILATLAMVRRRMAERAPAVALATAGVVAIAFLFGPAWQMVRNMPAISLRNYDEGRRYVEQVFATFDGRGEGAVLLHDWEHMTPMWYSRYVEERWPHPGDVRPEFVSTARPWLESVYAYLPGGPVYLNSYRREIVDAGFRLRPRGRFYQVVEPGDRTVPPQLTQPEEAAPAGEIEVVGYRLPQRDVEAGDIVSLTLAMRAPVTPTHYYVPVIRAGNLTFSFTTDSHLVTPMWQPGEVIVERFHFALPHNMPAGAYDVTVQVNDLTADRLTELALSVGTLQVSSQTDPPATERLLANFRQRVGLASAVARNGLALRRAPWAEALRARPGGTVDVVLRWQSLAKAEESYTVFVHLIDAANRPLVTLDYTPLGGAAPTHLWIPKWLPGQRLWDPYRMPIPHDLAPGVYYIEVGLYEMTSGRRLHLSDAAGNLGGDRFILGPIVVGSE